MKKQKVSEQSIINKLNSVFGVDPESDKSCLSMIRAKCCSSCSFFEQCQYQAFDWILYDYDVDINGDLQIHLL